MTECSIEHINQIDGHHMWNSNHTHLLDLAAVALLSLVSYCWCTVVLAWHLLPSFLGVQGTQDEPGWGEEGCCGEWGELPFGDNCHLVLYRGWVSPFLWWAWWVCLFLQWCFWERSLSWTLWRKKYREETNRHDNDYHDKATDSLVNYETGVFRPSPQISKVCWVSWDRVRSSFPPKKTSDEITDNEKSFHRGYFLFSFFQRIFPHLPSCLGGVNNFGSPPIILQNRSGEGLKHEKSPCTSQNDEADPKMIEPVKNLFQKGVVFFVKFGVWRICPKWNNPE